MKKVTKSALSVAQLLSWLRHAITSLVSAVAHSAISAARTGPVSTAARITVPPSTMKKDTTRTVTIEKVVSTDRVLLAVKA